MNKIIIVMREAQSQYEFHTITTAALIAYGSDGSTITITKIDLFSPSSPVKQIIQNILYFFKI